MSEQVRVIISVSGGVVQGVYAGDFVDVVLLDYDNMEQGDPPCLYPTMPESQMDDEERALVEAALRPEPCAGGCGREAHLCATADDPEEGCGDRDGAADDFPHLRVAVERHCTPEL